MSTSSSSYISNSRYYCPITKKLFSDPCVDSDGNNFDGPTIHYWIRVYGVSPMTGLRM